MDDEKTLYSWKGVINWTTILVGSIVVACWLLILAFGFVPNSSLNSAWYNLMSGVFVGGGIFLIRGGIYCQYYQYTITDRKVVISWNIWKTNGSTWIPMSDIQSVSFNKNSGGEGLGTIHLTVASGKRVSMLSLKDVESLAQIIAELITKNTRASQ